MSLVLPAFGFKAERFGFHQIHPKWRSNGVYLINNKEIYPGQYDIEEESFAFSKRNLDRSRPRFSWKIQYSSEQEAKMPSILSRPLKEEKIRLIQSLGPGKYDIAKALDYLHNKPSSKIGFLSNLTPRFKSESKEFLTPPPNFYANGGAPQAKKELFDAKLKDSCIRGILSTHDKGRRVILISDSGLSPSLYYIKSDTEKLIEKVTSLRGPYDLTTGPRSKSMDHLSVPVGSYQITSTIDALKHKSKRWNGTFPKCEQYPKRLGPNPENQIGPCTYKNVSKIAKPTCYDHNCPAFLCGAPRDKNSAMKAARSLTGPGRYNNHILRESSFVRTCNSSFNSKTSFKLTLEREAFLKERIKGSSSMNRSKSMVFQPHISKSNIIIS